MFVKAVEDGVRNGRGKGGGGGEDVQCIGRGGSRGWCGRA